MFLYQFTELGLAEIVFNNIKTFLYGLFVLERKYHPALKETCTHGSNRAVNNRQ